MWLSYKHLGKGALDSFEAILGKIYEDCSAFPSSFNYKLLSSYLATVSLSCSLKKKKGRISFC